jgi:hypothetical protein
MHRPQLLHLILEIGERFGIHEFHVIGSAAILAVLPEPPEGPLTRTRDIDVIPPGSDEILINRISFVLGEASDFDAQYGYHAQGVAQSTAEFAPNDWLTRAIPVRVSGFTAWCMEPNDLVISKLGAGRPKDLEFARAAVDLGLVVKSALWNRLGSVSASAEVLDLIRRRIEALFGRA